MGLDQCVFVTELKPKSEVDFEYGSLEEVEEFQYWRKHPNLHGFMAELYKEKGGRDEMQDFTGPVLLTESDILLLQKGIEEGLLTDTFGSVDAGDHHGLEDLEFIDNALEYIDDGKYIFYDSCW